MKIRAGAGQFSRRTWVAGLSAIAIILVVALVALVGKGSEPSTSHLNQPATAPPCTGSLAGGTCAPNTIELDGQRLLAARTALRAGDAKLHTELAVVLKQADTALSAGPWTVTATNVIPPSGDKRDYVSDAPYWWPTETKTAANPSGCPYVQRDGKRYPGASSFSDDSDRAAAFSAIYSLSLAWYYTGKAQYAQRAETDLRAWFLDSATGMNPNLNFAQLIPCQKDVRGIGIVDFSESLPNVIDAVALLDSHAPGWSAADHGGMKAWFSHFLSWMQSSPNGQDEKSATNNHGSFFDEMEAALALYTGQPALAKSIVLEASAARIDRQIRPDGSQPLELSRTLSWHYSMFNLMALTRLADVGRHMGVNLWSHTSPSGGSLGKAVDFLIPAATGAAAWSHPDAQFQAFQMLDVIHAAADAGDSQAVEALARVPVPPRDGDTWQLAPTAELLH